MALTDEEKEALTGLSAQLRAVAVAEGGELFMDWPDRWWDTHAWRCINGHVSTRVLKSEALGRDACLAEECRAPMCLTFPEDRDGPLRLRIVDGKYQGNPPLCSCEHIHRSSRTCPCKAPSKGAIKDQPAQAS